MSLQSRFVSIFEAKPENCFVTIRHLIVISTMITENEIPKGWFKPNFQMYWNNRSIYFKCNHFILKSICFPTKSYRLIHFRMIDFLLSTALASLYFLCISESSRLSHAMFLCNKPALNTYTITLPSKELWVQTVFVLPPLYNHPPFFFLNKLRQWLPSCSTIACQYAGASGCFLSLSTCSDTTFYLFPCRGSLSLHFI